MQKLDMEESGEKKSLVYGGGGADKIISLNSGANFPRMLKLIFQVFHLLLALGILVVGFVEFCMEPTIFDVFSGNRINRNAVPKAVFKNGSITDKTLAHILDAPIVFLFLTHFLSVVWLKCHGRFAWLITFCHLGSIVLFIFFNTVFSKYVLDWRYFSTRAVTILVDVIIVAFDWTFIITILLHIRGWFPFKVNKKHMVVPYHERIASQRFVVALWNFVALFLVLCLCLLVWFSRLYMSWACVREKSEIKLMCQFTNLVQCYPCGDGTDEYCDLGNITQCFSEDLEHDVESTVIRCIKPLYTVPTFKSAFCVFNYNIGPFTFVTVFSYVGGIYFFMRTVLNALVKCLYNILYIAVHCCWSVLQHHVLKKKGSPENTTINDVDGAHTNGTADVKVSMETDPRVSLLGPLPYLKQSKHQD